MNRSYLPDPASAPALFEGLLARRVFAFLIDMVFLAILSAVVLAVTLIAGIVTLGLGLLLIPIVLPIAVVAYYGATAGSHRRATLGMSAMDLVMTPTRGQPLDGWKVFIHPLLYWVTIWIAWPLLLLALFTPRRQLLHDYITGVLLVRRSPMERHWAAAARG